MLLSSAPYSNFSISASHFNLHQEAFAFRSKLWLADWDLFLPLHLSMLTDFSRKLHHLVVLACWILMQIKPDFTWSESEKLFLEHFMMDFALAPAVAAFRGTLPSSVKFFPQKKFDATHHRVNGVMDFLIDPATQALKIGDPAAFIGELCWGLVRLLKHVHKDTDENSKSESEPSKQRKGPFKRAMFSGSVDSGSRSAKACAASSSSTPQAPPQAALQDGDVHSLLSEILTWYWTRLDGTPSTPNVAAEAAAAPAMAAQHPEVSAVQQQHKNVLDGARRRVICEGKVAGQVAGFSGQVPLFVFIDARRMCGVIMVFLFLDPGDYSHDCIRNGYECIVFVSRVA